MANIETEKVNKKDAIEIKLEQIRFRFQSWLTRDALETAEMYNVTVKMITDQVKDRFLLDMDAFFLGEHVSDHLITYPEDWWQAFKDRWFPDWLIKKYPIKLTVHKFEYKMIYDKFKCQLPEESHKLIMNKRPIMDCDKETIEGAYHASKY